MKKHTLTAIFMSLFITAAMVGCTKDKSEPNQNIDELKVKVVNDFGEKLAVPLYNEFENSAANLKTLVEELAANPTQQNLENAREAWRAVRVIWEQCEGFLYGPVDDDSYDPYMDTWPTDHNAMDDLLNSATPLTPDFLAEQNDETELTLRGFHPLEYLLWDTDGNRQAASFTQREKDYMVALATDIFSNVSELHSKGQIFFSEELAKPGTASSRYTSYTDAIETMAIGLIDIISEVGEGKMIDPFNPADSTITESPYSHNSLVDFKNNIIGARNAYTCNFNGTTGTSLSDLVKAGNSTLDLEIKNKFETAINSFDGITTTFEQAVYNQRNQVQNTLDALESLKTTLDESLVAYIQQYVK